MRLAMTRAQFFAAIDWTLFQVGYDDSRMANPLFGMLARDLYLLGWEAAVHDQPYDDEWPAAKEMGWNGAQAVLRGKVG